MDIQKVVIPVSALVIVSLLLFYFLSRGSLAGAPSVSRPAPSSAALESNGPSADSPVSESAEDSTNFALGHESPADSEPVPIQIKPDIVAPSALPEGVVASINDAFVTKAELDAEINRLLISPTAHSGMKSQRKEDIRQLALQELVIRELAYQEAKRQGMTVSRAEISASLERIRGRYKDPKGFGEALKAEGMTEDELRARIERDLLLAKISKEEIDNRAAVTDKDAREHYESNKRKFTLPESLELWHIYTKVADGNDAEAKQKIEKALRELRNGKEFETVAYEYSEDEYKYLGGKYGSIHRGQLEGGLDEAVFQARENEITGPFRTPAGWHIVKVVNKKVKTQLTFEDVKENIKKALYQQRLRKTRVDFINRLTDGASIKYLEGLQP